MGLKKIFFGLESLPDQLLWFQRKETWEGDVKANSIRILGLLLFCLNEILNYHVFHIVDLRFHQGSMLIILIWLLASVNFHFVLRHHIASKVIPYLIPTIDLLMLTFLLFLADGTSSPLVCLYFLVIALSGLRFNSAVVLYTTGATMFGYLSVVQFTKMQKPDLLVPVSHVVIFILSMALMGFIVSHLLGRFFISLDKLSREEK